MKFSKILLQLVLFYSLLWAGNPTSVPLDHPIYHYLDRLETIGVLDNLRDGSKPFDRGHVGKLLEEAVKKRNQLSKIDLQKLEKFLLDFRFEIEQDAKYQQIEKERNWYSPLSSFGQIKKDFRRFFRNQHPEEENHLFLWENASNSFYFDFVQDFSMDTRSDNLSRSLNSQIYRLRGTITKNFAYALEIALVAIRGDENFRDRHPILKGSWRQTRGEKIFFDRSGGELAYGTKYVNFKFAHQPITWGVGESGQLILSDSVEQFPYLSIYKDWKWGRFIFLHGKLLSESFERSSEGEDIHADKWIAAHRFEFSPFRWMTIGLTEMIIYGKRSAEWAYLIPLNFYRSIEHNLRDRDNELIAIDFETKLFNGGKFYGAILFDEFKQSKLFTDWFGNKHAFQIGTHIVDPFNLNNFALRIEYAAIMPWVYTHKFSVNRYINDKRSLGHWAGPNSQIIYLHLEKDWHWRFRTGLKFLQVKHGDNYPDENIGGNILLGHETLLGSQVEPRETRKFLEGILSTNNRYEIYTTYEIFNDLFLNISLSSLEFKRADKSNNLTEFHFGFRLDY